MIFDFVNFRPTEKQEGAQNAASESNLATTPAQATQGSHNNLPIVGQAPVTGKFCGSNSKLGKGLITYDLQPIASCPGSNKAICRELRPDGNAEPKPICWAVRKRYRQDKQKKRLATNFQFSKSDQFVDWANGVIARSRAVNAVRLPGIGDMYNAAFVNKVREIVQANPEMRFWFYTRSWAVSKIWEQLKTLKAEPNLTMWLSWDRKMAEQIGPPPDRDVPWSWLATDDDDVPVEPVDLVWRNDGHLQWNQSLPEKHILGGSVVCPHEDGVSETTCAACGICWRSEKFRNAKIAALVKKYEEPTGK